MGPLTGSVAGGDVRLVAAACSAVDEQQQRIMEEVGKDANCTVQLNFGRTFPSGLYRAVQRIHEREGYEVECYFDFDLPRIEPDLVTPDLLAGFTLREHQIRIIKKMLNRRRGHCNASTGCGKTLCILAIAVLALREHGHRTLVIAGSKGTANQIATVFRDVCGDGINIGFIGDGRKNVGDITVAVRDTLNKCMPSAGGKFANPEYERVYRYITEGAQRVMIDECQTTGADRLYDTLQCCPALQKLGFSGTPMVHRRLRDLKVLAATGPELVRVGSEELVALGLQAFPKIAVVADPAIYPSSLLREHLDRNRGRRQNPWESIRIRKYRETYAAFYLENPHHNEKLVVGSALWFASRKLPTLVLCRRMEQHAKLLDLFAESGVPFEAVSGKTKIPDRNAAKARLSEGKIMVLLASDIFSRGEDMPACRGLVLAEGVKGFENCMQRIGRAMRAKDTGTNEAWVIDTSPPTSSMLEKHAAARISAYRRAGYAVQVFPKFDMKLIEAFFESRK